MFRTSRCVLYLPLLFGTSRFVMHSEGNIKVSSTARILYYNTQELKIIKNQCVSHLVLCTPKHK